MTNNKAHIFPANRYEFVEDTCIITTYFNPTGYKLKKRNFDKFIQPIKKSKIAHIIVECSINNKPYEIEKKENVVRVKSESTLWQKERLLNIALKHIPQNCSKIVWIDCDILFSNSHWLIETSVLLEDYPIVQPFKFAVRLPEGRTSYSELGDIYNSFAFIYNTYPNCLTKGDFDLHGHTGFAWAARKEIFNSVGFYDACITGSGDHLMAHAFVGDWYSTCMDRIFIENDKFFKHFERWCSKIYDKVKGKITYTNGVALHLWHGNPADRRYLERMAFLHDNKYNPQKDLQLNSFGCWEIDKQRIELATLINEYFKLRKEDGTNNS